MITPFSVPSIWVPTRFRGFDDAATDRINLAGCENHRVSPAALAALGQPEPEWLLDHWDSQNPALRARLGELHDVPARQVQLTSGALGAITYVFSVFTRAGTRVGILRPDWPGFRFFAEQRRTDVVYLDRPQFPFTHTLDDIAAFVHAERVEFLILSNPSAVTGRLWESHEIAALARCCPDTLFVVDEADAIYPHLSAAHLTVHQDNVVFIGSFSKFYGLSGLRIGYLVSPGAHAGHFAATINPAELTAPAIIAARAALDDFDYQAQTQATVARNLTALDRAVSASPFRLAETSRCFAAYLWADERTEDPRAVLDRHGIDIVAGQMFGLSRGGRVNLADPGKITALIAALAAEPAVVSV